jgi:predicted O-linked N-acetylglucosamine transferase (SPINDLY family)
LPTIAELFALGLRHYQAGQPQLAEPILRQVLSLDPHHGGALHLLGTLAYQAVRWDVAIDYFRQAVAADPRVAAFHSTLGAAYQAAGRFDDAAASHQQALALSPHDLLVLNNLGITLSSQGKHEEAIAAFRQALTLNPNDPELHNNLAAALRSAVNLDEAIACCREALRLRPDFAEAYQNLGNALLDQGRPDEAVTSYQQAVRLAPRSASAHHALGNALQAAGRLDQAIRTYQQALQLRPDDPEAYCHLGDTLLARNRVAEAAAQQQQALRLRPDYAEAHNGLGNAHYSQGRLDDAAACYRQALERHPDDPSPQYNLGVALQSQGRLAEARACFREAMRLRPDEPLYHSTYLGSLNYDLDVAPAALLVEHRLWAERHAGSAPQVPAHDNPPEPWRPLRVGYVSPDFRSHAAAYFLEPILAHHDRGQVEAICYAEVAAPDERTAYLRTLAHQWRDTLGLATEQLATLIRQDRLDILVDLAGHTAHNRLLVFARKPAPVQVSYLGYPCTTGLSTIDYRLVDSVTEPPDEPSASTEEVVRLDPVFCCYGPPPNMPNVTVLPAGQAGPVTFGSLHKLEKLNAAVLDLWCRILREAPTARLLLSRNTLQGVTAAYFRQQFQDRGVEADRVLFHHGEPVALQHLRIYEQIDIALDPFPWNGHTTACEAMWMGVPVIALRGRCHAGRMVASVLSCVGLTELVAATPEEYCRLAVDLARNISRLAELRRRLRGQMASSPLCDAVGFTRGLEAAYRRMWQRWCDERRCHGASR